MTGDPGVDSVAGKKICFHNPTFLGLENVTCIFLKSLIHVGKKLETKLQYFDRYLHKKNLRICSNFGNWMVGL